MELLIADCCVMVVFDDLGSTSSPDQDSDWRALRYTGYAVNLLGQAPKSVKEEC